MNKHTAKGQTWPFEETAALSDSNVRCLFFVTSCGEELLSDVHLQPCRMNSKTPSLTPANDF